MPRIADEVLDCVIYLYRTKEEAERGEKIGGSGFLVSVSAERVETGEFIYAVSNRHVVHGTAAPVVRLNTQEGEIDILEADVHHWTPHADGDDIAVALIGLNPQLHKFKHVPTKMFLTQEIIEQHNIGPGDDIFMVGRFVTHQGKQRNLPSVRFGNISMMPWEALQHPIYKRDQESVIVEMRSIGGYSGSPVFVHIPPFAMRPGAKGITATSYGPWLLGIDWGHIYDKQPVRNKYGHDLSEGWYVDSNSGMLGVVPSWKLMELLMSQKVKAVRDRVEVLYLDDQAKKTTGISLDSAHPVPPTMADNPQHREDFRRLLDAAVRGKRSDDQT